MADEKQTPRPDSTVLGGEAGVPGTAGSAAGGNDATPEDQDSSKPQES